MFVYPFLYGIYLSVHPMKMNGFSLANYIAFFTDQYQYKTVGITFRLAVPNTIVVVAISLLFAYNMRRGIWLERTITTILVLPISLGVILLSQGILGFYGGKGWFNQMLLGLGLLEEPLILTHNFTGVMLSLFMQQFPFCFLMLLGYISGIDPSIENSARTLGANPWTVFRRVMLPLIAPGLAIAFALVFVMSFAHLPLGHHAGPAVGLHPDHRHRRLCAGLRDVRHALRLGHRGDHGAVPAGRPAPHPPPAQAHGHGGDHGGRKAVKTSMKNGKPTTDNGPMKRTERFDRFEQLSVVGFTLAL